MAERTEYRPIVKYVGGKTSLLPDLLKQVPETFYRYHEPFVGGGALYFALVTEARFGGAAFEGKRWALLSDANRWLMQMYEVIRDDLPKLMRELAFLENLYHKQNPEDLYYRIRDGWNQGFRTPSRYIFLKQTGFNGLWRENARGQHNVSWGKYKHPKICPTDRLVDCGAALGYADTFNLPWVESMKAVQPGDFVYVDPPYLGTFDLYTKTPFGEEQHESLLRRCAQLEAEGVHVLYSNQASPELKVMIDEHWPSAKQTLVYARRFVNCDGDGREPVAEYLLRSDT